MTRDGRHSASQPRRRGPTDRERRTRIAEAAFAVVTKRGISGLTHRAVAEHAKVPLGSTTYHYVDRDALLLAAIEEAVAAYRRRIEVWRVGVDARSLVPKLGRLLESLTINASMRNRLRVEYELYLSAIRSENLRPISIEWDAILRDVIQELVGEKTAHALYVATNGLLMESVIHDKPLDRAGTAAVLSLITSHGIPK